MKNLLKLFKKLDKYLLQNYPSLWCLQLHWLLPIAAVGGGLMFLLLFAQNPATYDSQNENMLGWLYVISFGGLVIWLVYMFRFNPMKGFGIRPELDEWKNFLGTFFGVLILVLLPLLFYVARHTRVHAKLDEKTFVTALNDINFGLALHHELSEDSVIIRKYNDTLRYMSILHKLQGKPNLVYEDYYDYYDSVYLDVKDDSALYCYSLNQFRSIYSGNYATEKEKSMGIWSKKDIYYRLQKIKTKADTVNLYAGLERGMKTFLPWRYSGSQMQKISQGYMPLNDLLDSGSQYGNLTFTEYYRDAIEVVDQNSRYYSIYHWDAWVNIFHAMYYLVFFVTVFILIYRNMTLKTFMISIGVGGLLPILMGLIAVAIDAKEDDLFWMVFIVYLTAWALYFYLERYPWRTLAKGITLNILTVTTPLFGWFLAEWWIDDYRDGILAYQDIDYQLIGYVRTYGEIAGMLFFFILLQPFFKRAYVRWYSLPEE